MTGQAIMHPLLPLGGGVLLAPPVARTFGLGRPESIAAARAASADGYLVFSSLCNPEDDMSGASSVFGVGVRALVIESAMARQGVMRIFVEAEQRVHLRMFALQREGFYRVSVEAWDDLPTNDTEARSLYDCALGRFEALCRRSGLPAVTTQLVMAGARTDHNRGIRSLPWVMLSYLGQDSPQHWIPVARRQALLEAPSLPDRLRLLIELLDGAQPPSSLAADMTPFIVRAAKAAQLG
jgi:Lon protease-like protein